MNIDEVTALLLKAQAIDNRDVGRPTIAAWAELLADVPARLAADAVTEHYRTTNAWIMPADILRICRDPGFRGRHQPQPNPLAELEGIRVATPERIAQLRAHYGFPRDVDDRR